MLEDQAKTLFQQPATLLPVEWQGLLFPLQTGFYLLIQNSDLAQRRTHTMPSSELIQTIVSPRCNPAMDVWCGVAQGFAFSTSRLATRRHNQPSRVGTN